MPIMYQALSLMGPSDKAMDNSPLFWSSYYSVGLR